MEIEEEEGVVSLECYHQEVNTLLLNGKLCKFLAPTCALIWLHFVLLYTDTQRRVFERKLEVTDRRHQTRDQNSPPEDQSHKYSLELIFISTHRPSTDSKSYKHRPRLCIRCSSGHPSD